MWLSEKIKACLLILSILTMSYLPRYSKETENWGVGGRTPAHTPIFGDRFSNVTLSSYTKEIKKRLRR